LINPQQQLVEIYRQQQQAEVRNLPTQLFGEEVLLGFSLSLELYLDSR
jgi:Uma2 family endonuclease